MCDDDATSPDAHFSFFSYIIFIHSFELCLVFKLHIFDDINIHCWADMCTKTQRALSLHFSHLLLGTG